MPRTRRLWVLMPIALALIASQQPSRAMRSIQVDPFPFISTSFVEIFPEDFTDPESPLFGETLESFLTRISTTAPFVFPIKDPETGQIIGPIGGNLNGEPAFVEIDGRVFVRAGSLGEADSASVPLRFNGLIDSAEAKTELEFFADRVLHGVDGRPHHLHPIRYAKEDDVTQPIELLSKQIGLDVDGDLTNCSISDDATTPEDESIACDAFNIPGPDNGADMTIADWRPKTPVDPVTLGAFIEARGRALITPRRDDQANIRIVMKDLIPEQLYTVWQLDTDPLGRPIPRGVPMGGAPANVFVTSRTSPIQVFRSVLNHNPIGASFRDVQLGPLPPVSMPVDATIQIAVVWHTNGQNNGGRSVALTNGGGLRGG